LAEQRKALAREKAQWGQTVFLLLKNELLSDPVQLLQIPVDGYFSLPLLPVLFVLLDTGEISRERSIQYMQHQIALIDSPITNAICRKIRMTASPQNSYEDLLRPNCIS